MRGKERKHLTEKTGWHTNFEIGLFGTSVHISSDGGKCFYFEALIKPQFGSALT